MPRGRAVHACCLMGKTGNVTGCPIGGWTTGAIMGIVKMNGDYSTHWKIMGLILKMWVKKNNIPIHIHYIIL